MSFSECENSNKVLRRAQTIDVSQDLKEFVYYQDWIAGVQKGGSGTNLFIAESLFEGKQPTKVYFKGCVGVLNKTMVKDVVFYVTRFKSDLNSKHDYIMDAEGKKEYGNKLPIKKKDFPFDLKENEALVSCVANNKVKYLWFKNIPKKETLSYPSFLKDKEGFN